MELWNQAMLERGRELWDRDIERKPLQELLFETTTACNPFTTVCFLRSRSWPEMV